MITIIGRRLIIPDCDRVLGVTEDANTKIKIKLSSDTVERYFPDSANVDNVGITLVMEYEDGSDFHSVAFTRSSDGVHEGYVNLVGVTKVGLLRARALLTYNEETKDGDTVSTVTTSMQTEEDFFYISEDIETSGINKEGSTLTAWAKTLSDIKEETKDLEDAVSTATNAATSASDSAEKADTYALNASFAAGNAATSETNAMGYASDAEGYKDAALMAKDEAVVLVGKYSKHLPDNNNPHGVTAEQVGAYTKEETDEKLSGKADSGHKHTASEVGAYTKDEVDKLVEGAHVDLSGYVKNTDYATGSKGGVVKVYDGNGVSCVNGQLALVPANNAQIDARTAESLPITPKNLEYAVKSVGDGYYAKEDAVFETGSFAWTDFEYTVPVEGSLGNMASVCENKITISGTSEPIIIHCAGRTIGFTFSINGFSHAYLKINGEETKYECTAYDDSEFASNIVIPPTYMESDLEICGGMNTWNFTDMTIQNIKGITELESQIGDIDAALDSIIAIQESFAPTATLPGEVEEVVS